MTDAQTAKIIALAQAHPASRIHWPGRGVAPPGYMPGIALAYAQVYEALKRGDAYALEMAKPNAGDPAHDALSWYAGIFAKAGLKIGLQARTDGSVLRAAAVLVAGLGVRESGPCRDIGRDRSANNVTAMTAEAGIWQMSMNAFEATPLLPDLYAEWWRKNAPEGLESVFYEGIKHSKADMENFGEGPGQIFQYRLKTYPALAFWLAMLGLRYVRQHWGPINRREVTLEPAVDDLLKQVQAIVDAEAPASAAVA